jgi:hypothetical protein
MRAVKQAYRATACANLHGGELDEDGDVPSKVLEVLKVVPGAHEDDLLDEGITAHTLRGVHQVHQTLHDVREIAAGDHARDEL